MSPHTLTLEEWAWKIGFTLFWIALAAIATFWMRRYRRITGEQAEGELPPVNR